VLGFFEDTFTDFFGATAPIARIVGDIERKGAVTLDHCSRVGSDGSTHGFVRLRLRIELVLIGVEFEAEEPILVDAFGFATEGLEFWHKRTGLEGTMTPAPPSVSLTCVFPEPITLWRSETLELTLRGATGMPGPPYTHGVKFEPKSQFILSSKQLVPLFELIIYAHPFVNLLSFAMGKVVSVTRVVASSSKISREVGSRRVPVEIEVYYASLFFNKTVPRVVRHEMLFTFEHIEATSQPILDAWFVRHEKVLPAIHLFFDALTGEYLFINSRFLSLAQALETYHRRTRDRKKFSDEEFALLRGRLAESCEPKDLEFVNNKTRYWNELTLRERLRELVEPFADLFGPTELRKALVGDIVDTRNYFTHWDPTGRARAADGADLVKLCHRMEALFKLCLLRDLGFATEQIAKIVEECRPLKHLLTWPQEA
jgi:hypothetical protein